MSQKSSPSLQGCCQRNTRIRSSLRNPWRGGISLGDGGLPATGRREGMISNEISSSLMWGRSICGGLLTIVHEWPPSMLVPVAMQIWSGGLFLRPQWVAVPRPIFRVRDKGVKGNIQNIV
ncbi:hypothetical protein TIFTF001_039273 [Ficus carica]|uniref:Uncharacterized protein n=1 Tax=Ficus carica TaxID=3494 RepID=A0AA88E9I7_FICCA|nr:hypothetical protein TIFTF001_039273 [Ficus carica]